jgi:hypothetical protein
MRERMLRRRKRGTQPRGKFSFGLSENQRSFIAILPLPAPELTERRCVIAKRVDINAVKIRPPENRASSVIRLLRRNGL